MTKSDLIGAKVAGVLLLLTGVGLVVWVGHDAWLHYASFDWVAGEGTVTRAGVTVRSTGGSEDSEGLFPSYYPFVEYRFEVAGREYTGDRIAYLGAEGFPTRDAAFGRVRSFAEQKKLRVWYDPSHPNRSCLERGSLDVTTLLLLTLFGGLSGAGGILVLFPSLLRRAAGTPTRTRSLPRR